MNTFIPIKTIPDLHLTLLMTRNSLNFVVGEDRQQLLEFGRAAFAAGQQSVKPEARRQAGQEAVAMVEGVTLRWPVALCCKAE